MAPIDQLIGAWVVVLVGFCFIPCVISVGLWLVSTKNLFCFTGGHCGAISGVVHGYIKNATSLLTGGIVTFKCFNGFAISSTDETICSESRQWTSIPSCSGEYPM